MINMEQKTLAQAAWSVTNTGGIPINIGQILQWGIWGLFVMAGLIVAYNIIQGALGWVQSSGDKEKVDKARQRITSAMIGLIILFATLALIALVEQVFGVGLGLTKPVYIPSFCGNTGCFKTPSGVVVPTSTI